MQVLNTQANIFKVNGGLADDFANRPAPTGSFYLFYSLDTSEIFYDNGTWILISAAGGTPVNIYNSDGILTGNRNLDGNNNDLNFKDLTNFYLSDSTIFGQQLGISIRKFPAIYAFGGINFGNKTTLNIFDFQNKIYFSNNYQINGLNVDFFNNIYQFGQINNGNKTHILIDDQNSIINTNYNGDNIGLLFNYATQRYFLGDPRGIPNKLYLEVNNNSNYFTTVFNSQQNGLLLSYNSRVYELGQFVGGNQIKFTLDDTQKILGYKEGTSYNGLYVNFLNRQYIFGHQTGNNNTQILIDDTNSYFAVTYQGFQRGFYAFFPDNFYMGTETGNKTRWIINDSNRQFTTSANGTNNGININLQNFVFEFGRNNGGNTTNLKIDDAAGFPVQMNGANITQNTSGATSGIHLKVKINNVDYVIELKNP